MEHAEAIAEVFDAELKEYSYGVATFVFPDQSAMEEALARGADPESDVPLLEPNYIIPVEEPAENEEMSNPLAGYQIESTLPVEETWLNSHDKYNDPFLNPNSDIYQWHHNYIHSYAAWSLPDKETNIRVAVIDTGVNVNHVELSGNAVASASINDLPTTDTTGSGHGTHVAGIIGAKQNNATGGAGIAPGVKITSYQVFNGRYANTDDTIRALFMVLETREDTNTANDVHVVNMSLGGTVYSVHEQSAVSRLHDAGVTIVASAGNEYQNTPKYPAAYNDVIAVAAVNERGARANFSNYGSWVDIAAPGTNIHSSIYIEGKSNNQSYDKMSGTSQAAPIVAGACALYMMKFGVQSPDYMEAILKSTATKAASGLGAGIIDLSGMFSVDKYEYTNWWDETVFDYEENAQPIIKVTGSTTSGSRTITSYGSLTSSFIFHPDAVLTIAFDDYYSDFDAILQGKIIYTTDGKIPSVANGEPTGNTQVWDDSVTVNVGQFVNMANGKDQKVTVKAARVNALGKMSAVTTLAFKVRPTLDYYATVLTFTSAPSRVVAGKSVTFSATVTPSQKVTWSLSGYTGGLNAKNTKITSAGKLTTKAKTSGTVWVYCRAANGRSISKQITVSSEPMIKTISLDAKKVSLDITAMETQPTKTIIVTGIQNASGDEITYAKLQSDSLVRWTSSNAKVAKVNMTSTGAQITGVGKGTATITCQILDGSGKKASVTVTVVQKVQYLGVTGQSMVTAGKSATYKAVATPVNANNKSVTWSLYASTTDAQAALSAANAVDRVSVNAKGVVTVGKNVAPGLSFQLRATAKDGSGKIGYMTFYTQKKATRVTVDVGGTYKSDTNRPIFNPTYNKSGNLTGLRMFTYNVEGGTDETQVTISSSLYSGDELIHGVRWTSSNEKVLTVNYPTSATAVIRATGAGSATLTCAADDGSGVKAKVKVTVVTPASDIAITVPANRSNWYIGYGKSLQLSAALGNVYGKPSVSKVTWDYDVLIYDSATEEYDDSYAYVFRNAKLVSVKNGKLSVASAAKWRPYINYYANENSTKSLAIRVKATTTDGTNRTATLDGIMPVPATTYVTLYDRWIYGFKNGRFYYKPHAITSVKVSQSYETTGYWVGVNTDTYSGFSIKSSNDDIVTAVASGALYLYPHERGTATITLTANDGSGKKVTLKVKVVK